MSNSDQKQNIKIARVFQSKSLTWRQKHAAKTFYEKFPTPTMCTLYTKYNDALKARKNIGFCEKIVDKMYSEWKTSEHGPVSTLDEMKENKRLQRFVFAFYRRRFSDLLKSDGCILLHEAFDLTRMIEIDTTFVDHKLWINLITAATQSGKTFLMIALSHIFTALDYTPIFIVKDTKQNTQFFNRKISDSTKLQSFLKKEKFSKNNIALFDQPLYYDSNIGVPGSKAEDEYNNKVEASMNGSRRRGIVCIHNVKHIMRVYKNIQFQCKFVMFVDEAHKLGAYKIKGISSDTTSKKGAYDQLFLKLKCFAKKIFLFTATPQNIYFSEPELYTNGIVNMTNSETYHGADMWNMRLIPSKKEEITVEINTIDGITKIPRSFIDTMAYLSDKEPHNRINKFGIHDRHPINVLAKFECINEKQALLLSAFKINTIPVSDEHKKIIDTEWVFMTFNQFGVRVFHESLRGETITISKCTVIDRYHSGDFLFPNAEICEVWQWLATNGGVIRFPHIVTIAYRSAEEGITFSSSWGPTYKEDANWHLTDGYFRLGSGCNSSTAEQAFGRINGNHGDTIKPTLHCSLNDKKKVLKGINLHQEQTREMCELSFRHLNEKVINHVSNMEVFNNRIPLNYVSIPGANKSIKSKRNPDQAIEEDSFSRYKKSMSSFQMLNPDIYGDSRLKRARVRAKASVIAVDEIKDTSNGTFKYVSDKLNSGKITKISIFLSLIDTKVEYTRNDLEILLLEANYDQPKSIFLSITRPDSTWGPGCLFQSNGNKWKIIDSLCTAWN